MTCPLATYDSPDTARAVRRASARHWNFPISVFQCEKCDDYHLRVNTSKVRVPKQAFNVLKKIALGYTAIEIASDLAISVTTTRWYVRMLIDAFGAMSSSHLVFICTALGVLDPRDSVPSLTERCHDEPT